MNRKYSNLLERLIANSFRNDRFIFEGTPCWDWTGAFGTGGSENGRYPTLCVRVEKEVRTLLGVRVDRKVKTLRAHRVSYEEFTGEKLGDQEAGHKCNRTCCISPLHLKAETASANCYQRESRKRNEYEGAREFEPPTEAELEFQE